MPFLMRTHLRLRKEGIQAKKVLSIAGCGLGVIAGGLLIWNVILPVFNFFMEGFFGVLPGLLG